MRKEKTWAVSKTALILLGGSFLAFSRPRTVLAEGRPVTCVMTEEDAGNGYEYTVPGIGSFTVNDTEGSTFQAAVFDMGEGCFPVLYQDQEETVFEDGIVLDPGSYELRIYGNEDHDGNYGRFCFTIENDYAENLKSIAGDGEVKVEENPPLTVSWHPGQGVFRYTLPDGEYFETNVPVGGWFRGRMHLSVSNGLLVLSVRRDGKPVDITDGLDFAQAGSYEVVMRDNLLGTGGEVSYRVAAGFHLYVSEGMNLSHIGAPQGLVLDAAFLDGSPIEADRDFLHMSRDGRYRLLFADSQGRECWAMEFVRDTRAPAIEFDRYVDGTLLAAPVSFGLSEPMARVRIWRNREEVQAPGRQIAVNGVYHIEISDEAGNVRDYDFSMQIRYSMWNEKLFIIPFLFLFLAGAGFVYWRRNMRVL